MVSKAKVKQGLDTIQSQVPWEEGGGGEGGGDGQDTLELSAIVGVRSLLNPVVGVRSLLNRKSSTLKPLLLYS